jgi:hypothetical protein
VKEVEKMSAFIALQIMKAYDTYGLEAGQAKYRGYFICCNKDYLTGT